MSHEVNRMSLRLFAAGSSFLGLVCVVVFPWAPAVSAGELAFETVYTGEVFKNFHGGIRPGTRYLDNFDITVEYSMPNFGSDEEGTIFFYGIYNNDQVLSEDLVGDAQGVSNIDNSRNFRFYEFWYNQTFLKGRGSFKLGLFDLNSEFDVNETGSLFINSSHGIGPDFSQSGDNGPSIFPVTSLALRVQYAISDDWDVRAAVLDSAPGDPDRPARNAIKLDDGVLLVGESEFRPSAAMRFAVGGWHYFDKFDRILPDPEGSTFNQWGAYVMAEGTLTREAGDESQGLSGFLRTGFANDIVNQIGTYLGLGVVYTGSLSGRDSDQVGLAIALARNGGDFKTLRREASLPVNDFELNVELSYRIQVTDWLTLQPDLQYIIHPGAVGELRNAIVGGIRFQVGRSW